MQSYNLTIVVDGELTPAKRKTVKESMEKLLSSLKGKVSEVSDLGTKDLAYPIKKARTGYFWNYSVDLEGDAAKGVLSKLQHDDNLLRYLLVRKEHPKSNGKKSK